MYVVGAIIMSAFWEAHPGSEAELRALHALLTDASPVEVKDSFAATGQFEGSRVTLDLVQTRVRLDINEAARVARILSVEAREVD